MVIQGGTCTYPTDPTANPYIQPGSDRDGDNIDNAYDLCPDDPENDCTAQKAVNKIVQEIVENRCDLIIAAVGLFTGGVAAALARGGLTATQAAHLTGGALMSGGVLSLACGWE